MKRYCSLLALAVMLGAGTTLSAQDINPVPPNTPVPGSPQFGGIDVGWAYTPTATTTVNSLQTRFSTISGWIKQGPTPNFVTLEIYLGIPVNGGTLLRAANFVPVAGAYAGATFADLTLTAGTQYFIGFFNVQGLGTNETSDGPTVLPRYFQGAPDVQHKYFQRAGDTRPTLRFNPGISPCTAGNFNSIPPNAPIAAQFGGIDVGWVFKTTDIGTTTLTQILTRFSSVAGWVKQGPNPNFVTLEIYKGIPVCAIPGTPGCTPADAPTRLFPPTEPGIGDFAPVAGSYVGPAPFPQINLTPGQNYFVGFFNVQGLGSNETSTPGSIQLQRYFQGAPDAPHTYNQHFDATAPSFCIAP